VAFTFGRITTIPIALPEPLNWESSGTQIRMTGGFTGSVANAIITRDQLLGYANNVDEPIVAITSTVDASQSGFYRILGVAIPSRPESYVNGHFDYQIDLEQIPGYVSPLVESTLIGGLVPNAASIALGTSQPWHAVPSAVASYGITGIAGPYTGLPGGAAAIRTAADGALAWVGMNTANYANKATFQLPAASFYNSAAQIQGGVLSTIYPIVGRQISPVKGDWRITNGLVRVQSRTQYDGILISWYNGSTWSANHGFTYTVWPGTWTLAEGDSIRVLRNSPEEVVVRANYLASGGGVSGGRVTVDLALRRGARVVRCFLAYGPVLSSPVNVNVAHVGALACTAITGGIRATANDGDGNRPVLMSAMTVTNDLVNGALAKTTGALSDTFDFGLGNEIPGANIVAGNQAQDLVYQYVAGQAESQRVVVR
jgi:hypothetical protein